MAETTKRIPREWRYRVRFTKLPEYFTHDRWVVARANGSPIAYADTLPDIWQTVEFLIECDKRRHKLIELDKKYPDYNSGRRGVRNGAAL